MEIKWSEFAILMLITFLFLTPSAEGKGFGKCDEDWECGEGFYCSSNFCETCVPCEKVFYRQSPSSSCAKSVSNCGDCLNGFQADDWSDQKFFHKCLPVKSSDSSVVTSAVSRQSAWSVFFLSLFGWIIISLY
uniref:TNFR-Cys domain-containing protein n=1 Tax=Daphnia galeata TaxID=27404 RepID=A0A8J2RS72_9CRUS|nr:unnamed protein product [Daphnia galeata]